MSDLRGALVLLVALAGAASAQDGGDPAVTEADLDTSVPEPDESYLGAETAGSASAPPASDAPRRTPGLALVAVLAVAALAAIATRRA